MREVFLGCGKDKKPAERVEGGDDKRIGMHTGMDADVCVGG